MDRQNSAGRGQPRLQGLGSLAGGAAAKPAGGRLGGASPGPLQPQDLRPQLTAPPFGAATKYGTYGAGATAAAPRLGALGAGGGRMGGGSMVGLGGGLGVSGRGSGLGALPLRSVGRQSLDGSDMVLLPSVARTAPAFRSLLTGADTEPPQPARGPSTTPSPPPTTTTTTSALQPSSLQPQPAAQHPPVEASTNGANRSRGSSTPGVPAPTDPRTQPAAAAPPQGRSQPQPQPQIQIQIQWLPPPPPPRQRKHPRLGGEGKARSGATTAAAPGSSSSEPPGPGTTAPSQPDGSETKPKEELKQRNRVRWQHLEPEEGQEPSRRGGRGGALEGRPSARPEHPVAKKQRIEAVTEAGSGAGARLAGAGSAATPGCQPGPLPAREPPLGPARRLGGLLRPGGLTLPPRQARPHGAGTRPGALLSALGGGGVGLAGRQPLRDRRAPDSAMAAKEQQGDVTTAAAAAAEAAFQKFQEAERRAACIATLLVPRPGLYGQVPEISRLTAAHWARLQRSLESRCRGPVHEALNALLIYSFTEPQRQAAGPPQPQSRSDQEQGKRPRTGLDVAEPRQTQSPPPQQQQPARPLGPDPGPDRHTRAGGDRPGKGGGGAAGDAWDVGVSGGDDGGGGRGVYGVLVSALEGAGQQGPAVDSSLEASPAGPGGLAAADTAPAEPCHTTPYDTSPAGLDPAMAGRDSLGGLDSPHPGPPRRPQLASKPCCTATYDSLESALRTRPGVVRALWGLVHSALPPHAGGGVAVLPWPPPAAVRQPSDDDDPRGQGQGPLPDDEPPPVAAPLPGCGLHKRGLKGALLERLSSDSLSEETLREGLDWEQELNEALGTRLGEEVVETRLGWAACAANVLRNLAAAELVPEQLSDGSALDCCAAVLQAAVADPNAAFNELAATLLELLTALPHFQASLVRLSPQPRRAQQGPQPRQPQPEQRATAAGGEVALKGRPVGFLSEAAPAKSEVTAVERKLEVESEPAAVVRGPKANGSTRGAAEAVGLNLQAVETLNTAANVEPMDDCQQPGQESVVVLRGPSSGTEPSPLPLPYGNWSAAPVRTPLDGMDVEPPAELSPPPLPSSPPVEPPPPLLASAPLASARTPAQPPSLLQCVLAVLVGSHLPLRLRTLAAGLVAAWLATQATRAATLAALQPPQHLQLPMPRPQPTSHNHSHLHVQPQPQPQQARNPEQQSARARQQDAAQPVPGHPPSTPAADAVTLSATPPSASTPPAPGPAPPVAASPAHTLTAPTLTVTDATAAPPPHNLAGGDGGDGGDGGGGGGFRKTTRPRALRAVAEAEATGPLAALGDFLCVDAAAALAAARREAAGEMGYQGLGTLADGTLPPYYVRLLAAVRQADAVAAAVEVLHSLAVTCGPAGQALIAANDGLVRHLVRLATGHVPCDAVLPPAGHITALASGGGAAATPPLQQPYGAAAATPAAEAEARVLAADPMAAQCRTTLVASGDVAVEVLAALAGGGVAAARAAVGLYEQAVAVHVCEGGARGEALAGVLSALL